MTLCRHQFGVTERAGLRCRTGCFCAGIVSECRFQLNSASGTFLCFGAIRRCAFRMSFCELQFCSADGAIFIIGASSFTVGYVTFGGSQFRIANGTSLTVRAICCCAGRVSLCFFDFKITDGTFLRFRAGCCYTGRVPLCFFDFKITDDTFLRFCTSCFRTGSMTFCGGYLCAAFRAVLCRRASCRFAGRMTLCGLQFDMADRTCFGNGTACGAGLMTSCGGKNHMANRAFLRIGAGCRRAGLVSGCRFQFCVANGAMLTFGTVRRLTGRVTLGGDGFLLNQRFLAERAVLTLRQAVLRTGRSDCAVDHGDMVTTVLFFRDHVYAEMVGGEGNIAFRYRCGNLFCSIAAHIVYDGTLCGDAARQGKCNGNVAFDFDLITVTPKLHIVKTVGALIDGERSDCGFHLVVCLRFGNLKFGSQFKSSRFCFNACMVFGVGKIFDRGILHQIPCKESACAQKGGDQKRNQALFYTLFCDGRLVMLIFGDVLDRNIVRFCQFLCVLDGSRSMFIFQMLVIVAVDLSVQEQS